MRKFTCICHFPSNGKLLACVYVCVCVCRWMAYNCFRVSLVKLSNCPLHVLPSYIQHVPFLLSAANAPSTLLEALPHRMCLTFCFLYIILAYVCVCVCVFTFAHFFVSFFASALIVIKVFILQCERVRGMLLHMKVIYVCVCVLFLYQYLCVSVCVFCGILAFMVYVISAVMSHI